ncbi:MAG TPA: hypothetical protein VG101_10230 [Puia sp.]|nr:hypothetical protein [Puia sp.]
MNVHVKLVALALSCGLSAAGQVHPVPFMWVSAGVDSMARVKFTKAGYPGRSTMSKAQIFNSAIAGTHPAGYVYPVAAIDQLISLVQADNQNNSPRGTGIRAHFAAYHAASVPAGFSMGGIKDKQVILIFCGSTGAGSADVATYYVISPADNQPHKISAAIMQDWCDYYYSNVNNSGGLVSTLEPGHKGENQWKGADFDTRSIYYTMDHFIEYLQVERRYQDTCKSCNPRGAKIDGIGVYFASYPNTGIGPNPHGEDPAKYKNRLLVLFEFMRGSRVYFIDNAPGFCDRPPGNQCGQPLVIQASFRRSRWGGGDNGQLCPPNCPLP